jgi:hypothetical protein
VRPRPACRSRAARWLPRLMVARRERNAANATPRRWCSAEGLQPRTEAGPQQLQLRVRPRDVGSCYYRLVARATSKLQARCSSCRRETKHKVLREANVSHTNHDAQYEAAYGEDIHWTDVFQIVKCDVCDEVGFRRVTWFNPTEEWQGLEEYPAPLPRDLPPWHVRLPPLLRSLAVEVYRAMAEDSRRLALMAHEPCLT